MLSSAIIIIMIINHIIIILKKISYALILYKKCFCKIGTENVLKFENCFSEISKEWDKEGPYSLYFLLSMWMIPWKIEQ